MKLPAPFVDVIDWFLTTNIWVKIARKYIAYFTFRTFGYPKFPMEKYFDIKKIMSSNPEKRYGFVAADINSLSWKLTNFFTGANWGHAGVLYMDGEHVRASHMKGNGLNDWHVLDILRESDHFAVYELEFENIEAKKTFDKRFKFIRESVSATLTYDFTMSLDQDVFDWITAGTLNSTVLTSKKYSLYCSEYNYALCDGLVPKMVAKKYNGRLIFEPDDAYRCNKVVFEA